MSSLMSLDGNFLLFLQERMRAEAWDPVWIVITCLGNGGIVWFAVTILLLLSKRTRETGLAVLLSMAVCFLCANILLKNVIARARPYETVNGLTTLIPYPTDFSFPSGHTTASFACALVLLRKLPRRYGVPAVFLAVLIAFSRLYVGVHYLTDVLGGVAVALAGSSLALTYLRRRKNRKMGL